MRKSLLLLSLLLFSGLLQAQQLTYSNLPIVVIQTYGGAQINDEPKIPAFMGIIKNAGDTNFITDPYNDYSGKIMIEQRGASSQMFSQKQYKIITIDGMDSTIDVPIMGMPAEHDWVLYAPYNDKTLMRNYMIYNLMREMGHWAPRTEYCEVLLNGEYRGVYVMVENVKRSKKRVNVAKMDYDDNAGDSLTGGYIFRSDWDGGFVHYPKNATPAQTNYITNATNNLSNLLSSPNFNDPVNGYSKYIKVSTFIDYMLIVEFCNNQDSYHASTYFYKENIASDSGQIKAGPVWDYNFAFGISPWYGALDTGWIYEKAGTGINAWMNQLMQDSTYRNKARCRWDWLRHKTLDTTYVFHKMDSIADLLKDGRQRHFVKYPILPAGSCSDCFNNYSPLQEPSTYEGDLQYMKDWLKRRLAWIDANLPGTCHEVGIKKEKTTKAYLSVYPNPVEDKLYVNVFLNETSPVSLELYSATGQRVGVKDMGNVDAGDHLFTMNEFSSLSSGLYLLKVNTGTESISKTLIKK